MHGRCNRRTTGGDAMWLTCIPGCTMPLIFAVLLEREIASRADKKRVMLPCLSSIEELVSTHKTTVVEESASATHISSEMWASLP